MSNPGAIMRCIRRTIFLGLAALVPAAATAQHAKRAMEHDVYNEWRSIDGEQLSPDGQWVAYSLTVADGDAALEVRSVSTDQVFAIPRGVSPEFSANSRLVAFTIKPADTLVKQARLDKTSPDDMPKDSLGYIDLTTGNMTRVGRVKSLTPAGGSRITWKKRPSLEIARKLPHLPQNRVVVGRTMMRKTNPRNQVLTWWFATSKPVRRSCIRTSRASRSHRMVSGLPMPPPRREARQTESSSSSWKAETRIWRWEARESTRA